MISPGPAIRFQDDRGLRVTAALVAAAFLVRLPSFVYSVYNYDESLYVLMGAELARGHLPYTTVCDLKPFGLFALFAAFTSLPLDGVVASRVAACLVVGLSADLVRRIAGHLFDDPRRLVGLSAGLAYILFSIATGGIAAQGEIFHNAAVLLALLVVLRALRDGAGLAWRPALAAGLALGVGLQIKPSVAFDAVAVAVGALLLRPPAGSALAHARRAVPGVVAMAAASLVPTLAVVALYALAGQLDAWWAGNVTAHRVFYGPGRGFEWDPALRAAWEQAPLWAAAAIGLATSGRLTWGGAERRVVAFLAVWVGAIAACMVFLRIASDHYFLQFLSPLSLLAGLLVGRGLLEAVERPAARMAALAGLAALSFFAIAKEPLIHSGYILAERWGGGERFAGDTPRRIAADLRPRVGPEDRLYVVGFQPLVYYLTGARPATRFAFTGLPHRDHPGRDGCPWVDQETEMRRVLDSAPRFVVVEDGIFLHDLRPPVRAVLDERLARDYRLLKRYEQHHLHHLYPFERFVMNGGAPALVYERAEEAASPELSALAP